MHKVNASKMKVQRFRQRWYYWCLRIFIVRHPNFIGSSPKWTRHWSKCVEIACKIEMFGLKMMCMRAQMYARTHSYMLLNAALPYHYTAVANFVLFYIYFLWPVFFALLSSLISYESYRSIYNVFAHFSSVQPAYLFSFIKIKRQYKKRRRQSEGN